ncbi:MAG: hypothetical protein JSV88_09215 [Candidatus Aminicenantes bacterium]|nr:MAG: hypothetical protein JSV88_09215 [Candidatus Aminicenantes bacterium]
MKIKIFLLFFLASTLALFPAGQEQTQPTVSRSYGVDYTAGLNFSYNRVAVLMGDDNIENTLVHSYLALEVDVGLMDYLTVGVVAGYDSNDFADPVDFYNLPLSLRLSDQAYNSMVFGLRAKSDFLSWKDFSFNANAEILFFKLFKKEHTIDLPIVTGTSTIKHSFTQVALELLVQYDAFSTFTIFAGPQMNLVKGKITAAENIEELQGEEELEYQQKNTMGFAGGVLFELGSHFDLKVKVNLFSKTSLSVEVFYIF